MKKTKFDKEIKERMRKEGFNFNPRVTGFTDICTRIRLAAFLLLSATLSLLSITKTYSSSYIRCRMKPFTVFRVAKDKAGKKTEQQTELNVLNLSDVCMTVCNPVCPQNPSILYAF